jgi:hypothetical protein
MVAERIHFKHASGVGRVQEVISNTDSSNVASHVQFSVIRSTVQIHVDQAVDFDADESGFHALALEGLADVWDNSVDAVYDKYLEDAELH